MYGLHDKQGLYQPLSTQEEVSSSGPRQSRTLWSGRTVGVAVALVLAFVLSVALGAILDSTLPIRSFWQGKPQVTHCGRTSSEARALGCVLEPMVYGWMPPQCQFPEVTKQHDPFKKWQWYADENMTQPLSEEQLYRGESIDLWTNVPGYHLEHCLFLYRKLMYGLENRVEYLDKKTLGAHHAFHCVGQLSTSREAWNATTWTGLAMYDCVKTPWS